MPNWHVQVLWLVALISFRNSVADEADRPMISTRYQVKRVVWSASFNHFHPYLGMIGLMIVANLTNFEFETTNQFMEPWAQENALLREARYTSSQQRTAYTTEETSYIHLHTVSNKRCLSIETNYLSTGRRFFHQHPSL